MLTDFSTRVLVGFSMLLVGVVPGVLWHHWKRDAGGTGGGVVRALLWGAAAWGLGVAAKVAWALPLNAPVKRGLTAALGGGAGDVAFWIYIGLLTGVFESGAALLVLRRTKIMSASPREAIAFGLGFGGVEAVILGLASLVVAVALVAAPQALPEPLRSEAGAGIVLIGVAERLSTIVVHLFAALLIVQGARVGQPRRWFVASLALKTAVDGIAARAILHSNVKASLAKLTIFEIELGLAAVVLLGATIWLVRSWQRSSTAVAVA
ncbi:MAG: YhfC family intramembrane metalloprotease [Polyangiaceae bacterium]|nr:YhfC family intramembrane metalloprotease [Polyangiaceae bacterium]